ncbi:MAG: DNA-3-methyladenine glycosylase I [Candidatus Accumulibacter sp.]|jgi:DNA-3-methyladenine glycosylase I|nr:DNA-3-methyladenine glycosylase I [Accumulibacter sp.]
MLDDLEPVRCFWCHGSDLLTAYHDDEWGYAVTDDCRLFEKICLEGFQSGLSWLTILRKREAFRAAFAGFDCQQLANYGEHDVERLLHNEGIVRHRGKIEATINNARRALAVQEEFGSLSAYFWRFEVDVSARPQALTAEFLKELTPCPEALALAKDLRQRGWKFVGPTTVYAFMQAMGLVNDHQHDCHVAPMVRKARLALAETACGQPRKDGGRP